MLGLKLIHVRKRAPGHLQAKWLPSMDPILHVGLALEKLIALQMQLDKHHIPSDSPQFNPDLLYMTSHNLPQWLPPN